MAKKTKQEAQQERLSLVEKRNRQERRNKKSRKEREQEKRRKKQERDRRKQKNIPTTAQQSIPYIRMLQDGICQVTKTFFSKTIQFYDINYQLALNEDKTTIFENYCDFLNYFDSSISVQLINWKILKQSEGQLLATNAYALLTSDYFSFSKTQCAVFKGTDRAMFLDKREFTGPIYTQIEEAVDFVLRNIRLGATIDGLVRKEKYELPPEAIREMIINAHCHRNLLDESCIQVAVYDDRLEVTSPGGLYNGLTYEEVMNGHSKIRNKGIANIFSQMGLVEAWGSGIKRILNAAEEYGLPKPRF